MPTVHGTMVGQQHLPKNMGKNDVDSKVPNCVWPVVAEADLGMFSMFGRTGAPTKRGPTRGPASKRRII